MSSMYHIEIDNLNPNLYHVSVIDRMGDVNDNGFDILVSDTIIQIIPNIGHEKLYNDPLAPQPLRRQYTAHKHHIAEMSISDSISNTVIGGWHDLSGRFDESTDTDNESLFRILGHMFVVKRTKRLREIIYYIRDMEYKDMAWFKYPFVG